MWPDVRLHTADVRLDPGDRLVVYTDGITDQGPGPRPSPLQVLREQPPGADADTLAGALEASALADRGGHGRNAHPDDIAVIALRFVGAPTRRAGIASPAAPPRPRARSTARPREDGAYSLGNSGWSLVTAPPPPPAP